MGITIDRNVACDGCEKQIVGYQGQLYKVTLIDESEPSPYGLHFHDYNCVKLYATRKQKELDAKYELAAAHAELHTVLDAHGVDKVAWVTSLTPEGEAGGALEDLSIKETRKWIADASADKIPYKLPVPERTNG